MINSGLMSMPLHFGKMPKWLSERMGKMGFGIVESVIQNYGKSEVLTRFSDPNWFQALGAVMGMQWNSSGVTATVLGSLKRKVNPMNCIPHTELRHVLAAIRIRPSRQQRSDGP